MLTTKAWLSRVQEDPGTMHQFVNCLPLTGLRLLSDRMEVERSDAGEAKGMAVADPVGGESAV